MSVLPKWLTKKVYYNHHYGSVHGLLESKHLHTVCVSARCPNRGECFSHGTATFLVLGTICTRHCRFCAVAKGKPVQQPSINDIERLIDAVVHLGLSYVVVTSVTRDDLPDGGAGHFREIIRMLKQQVPGIKVEVLIPDFNGDAHALTSVLAAEPHVLNHNVETVARLYPSVRPGAVMNRSLMILTLAKRYNRSMVKSGLMLGLGETDREIKKTINDLREAGVDILTLGQYLAPNKTSIPTVRYVWPKEFEYYQRYAEKIGIPSVVAGPFVRSSYRAEACYQHVIERRMCVGL
ncbi:MAG: lipoyl synthase [Elusimicrobia bacterium]|nr:lipoyl synthase [Elusimicrobiota bacterium]MBD3411917.1 lipoyl synthase [Elusimicrobiota bacterium]